MIALRLRSGTALAILALLAACSDKGGDPARQYGPNPVLPEPRQYLGPPMSVPQVSAGSRRSAERACWPAHPRRWQRASCIRASSTPCPTAISWSSKGNGPGSKPFRPKDYIQGKVKARAGAAAKGGNRITLLRDADGDGVPELRTVLVDKLHSPYGVAWVAGTLYVANTDAIIAFPYALGQTKLTVPGTKLTDLPAGPINHHWTKAMVASPDGTKLYVGAARTAISPKTGWTPRKVAPRFTRSTG